MHIKNKCRVVERRDTHLSYHQNVRWWYRLLLNPRYNSGPQATIPKISANAHRGVIPEIALAIIRDPDFWQRLGPGLRVFDTKPG